MHTPSITVYGPELGSSFRVHWTLRELGIAYTNDPLDMRSGDHKKPAYLAVNPTGQVPTMVYDGVTMTESMAIAHFLADKHAPALLGATPEDRANGLRWELFVILNIQPNLVTIAGKVWGKPATEEAQAAASAALGRFLPIFESWMASRSFILGDHLSVADIVAEASFHYAEVGSVSLTAYPAITGWLARCASRPAYKKP